MLDKIIKETSKEFPNIISQYGSNFNSAKKQFPWKLLPTFSNTRSDQTFEKFHTNISNCKILSETFQVRHSFVNSRYTSESTRTPDLVRELKISGYHKKYKTKILVSSFKSTNQ